jgi:hypothetical protein
VTRPEDESRTELAWREIVENYGERVLPDDSPRDPEPEPTTYAVDPEPDEDEPADEVAEVDRFMPPPPPPLPRPRTWQRGAAWAGIFVAPVLALLIGVLAIYVTPLLLWALLAWFVGGFAYLVRVMPRSPRDPWDDGSRV